MSKDPLPKNRASAQMRALYAAMDRGEIKGGLSAALDAVASHHLKGGVIDRETYERRQKKGAYPIGLSYDEYVRRENLQRANIDAEIARLNERNAEYEAAVAADPSLENVWCNITSGLEPGREMTTSGECLRRHKAYSDKLNPANKVFRPIVEGLTAVGDVAADLLSEAPGVGAVASQVYQSFAPPGSKYRGSGKKLRGCGRFRDAMFSYLYSGPYGGIPQSSRKVDMLYNFAEQLDAIDKRLKDGPPYPSVIARMNAESDLAEGEARLEAIKSWVGFLRSNGTENLFTQKMNVSKVFPLLTKAAHGKAFDDFVEGVDYFAAKAAERGSDPMGVVKVFEEYYPPSVHLNRISTKFHGDLPGGAASAAAGEEEEEAATTVAAPAPAPTAAAPAPAPPTVVPFRAPSEEFGVPPMRGMEESDKETTSFGPTTVVKRGRGKAGPCGMAEPECDCSGRGTHRQNVLRRLSLPDKSHSLAQLAKASGVPKHILQEVYNRGIGAYKTQPKSVRLKGSFVKNVAAPMSKKLSKEQWAYARVYSFLDGNPRHDEDLRRNLEGAGFFGDVWNAAKAVVGKVSGRVKDVARGVRMDYAPAIRNLLPTIGDKPIVEAYVRRDPIRAPLNTAINLLTLGKWNEVRRKYNYDKLFHLGLEVVIRVSDESMLVGRYVLEKNEVINISPAKGTDSQTQLMRVNLPEDDSFTINRLLAGGQRILGPKFFPYDAFDNNCQDFIIALLQGAGLLTTDVATFVKQPLEKVLAGLPGYTQKLARLATDAGAVFNVALQGRGGLKPGPAFERQLTKAGISPLAYLDAARKAAKKAGLAHEYLGFSDNDIHKLQIPNEEGKIIRFGRVGHGDFLYYSLSKDPRAAEHRKSYRARATKIRGNWAKDDYSPNSLAINVLW